MRINTKTNLILLGVLFVVLTFIITTAADAIVVGGTWGYEDPAACTVNWEFEPGLIPGDWRSLKGFVYNNSPAEFIGWLFTVALGFAGFLSLVMIVVAGIEYTASQGNSGSQSRAKERIQNALLGLGLLIISFVLLRTINPSLVSIKNPLLSTQFLASSTAQTCKCEHGTGSEWSRMGRSSCATHNPCVDTFGNKTGTCAVDEVRTSDGGYKTNFYCCNYSEPTPPPGGDFGGGSSGGGGGGAGGGF